jgi:hypothetical protein
MLCEGELPADEVELLTANITGLAETLVEISALPVGLDTTSEQLPNGELAALPANPISTAWLPTPDAGLMKRHNGYTIAMNNSSSCRTTCAWQAGRATGH